MHSSLDIDESESIIAGFLYRLREKSPTTAAFGTMAAFATTAADGTTAAYGTTAACGLDFSGTDPE